MLQGSSQEITWKLSPFDHLPAEVHHPCYNYIAVTSPLGETTMGCYMRMMTRIAEYCPDWIAIYYNYIVNIALYYISSGNGVSHISGHDLQLCIVLSFSIADKKCKFYLLKMRLSVRFSFRPTLSDNCDSSLLYTC